MENYNILGTYDSVGNSRNFIFFIWLPDLEQLGKPKMKIHKIMPVYKNNIYILIVILRHGNLNDVSRYQNVRHKVIESKKGKLKNNFPTLPSGQKIGVITIHEEKIPLHTREDIFIQAIKNNIIQNPNHQNPFYDPHRLNLLIENYYPFNKAAIYAPQPIQVGSGGTLDPIP